MVYRISNYEKFDLTLLIPFIFSNLRILSWLSYLNFPVPFKIKLTKCSPVLLILASEPGLDCMTRFLLFSSLLLCDFWWGSTFFMVEGGRWVVEIIVYCSLHVIKILGGNVLEACRPSQTETQIGYGIWILEWGSMCWSSLLSYTLAVKCASLKSLVIFMPRIDLWAVEACQQVTEGSDPSSTDQLSEKTESHSASIQVVGKENEPITQQCSESEMSQPQDATLSTSHAWSLFVEQVESIRVSTSVIILVCWFSDCKKAAACFP